MAYHLYPNLRDCVDREKLDNAIIGIVPPIDILVDTIKSDAIAQLYKTNPEAFDLDDDDKRALLPAHKQLEIACRAKVNAKIKKYKEDPSIMLWHRRYDLEWLQKAIGVFPEEFTADEVQKFLEPRRTVDARIMMSAFAMTGDARKFKVNVNKIPSHMKDLIAEVNPAAFVKYGVPFTGVSEHGWRILIAYDGKYKDYLLEHISTIRDTTSYARCIEMLEPSSLKKEHFSLKKPPISFSRIAGLLKPRANELPPEVKTYINQHILTEMIKGKRKKPIQL